MKCLAGVRDRNDNLANCDKRTFWAMCQLLPNWGYELRYCPEHYEAIIGKPAPPRIFRGDAPNYPVLDIQTAADKTAGQGTAKRGATPAAHVSESADKTAGQQGSKRATSDRKRKAKARAQ